MKQSLYYLLLVTALAAGRPSATAAPPHTGIQGRAYHYTAYGSFFPIEVEPGVWIWIGVGGVQLPVTTSFSVLSPHNQREVARVTTDAEGFYSVSLPPGKYVLVPDTLVVNAFPFACEVATNPIEIEVKAREFAFQNIFYFSQGPCSLSWLQGT